MTNLDALKRAVARSPGVTKLFFGIRVPRSTQQGHWDYSTLVLFSELRRVIRAGHRVLEMGTGETGTLTVALARRTPARYTALDLEEATLKSASRVAADNGVTGDFVQSDLFSALPLDATFDVVFFNPPYVPHSRSKNWKALGEPSRVWDGGADGLDVIRRFWAQAEGRAGRLGVVLMGFNRQSVSEASIESLARQRGFTRRKTRRALHPGTVMTFAATTSGNPR